MNTIISIDEQEYFNLCSLSATLTDNLYVLLRIVRDQPQNRDAIYTQIHYLKDQIEQIDQKIQGLAN